MLRLKWLTILRMIVTLETPAPQCTRILPHFNPNLRFHYLYLFFQQHHQNTVSYSQILSREESIYDA